MREVAEETGLRVRVLRWAGRVLRDGPDGVVFSIDDYFCAPTDGRLEAATDADDARWVDAATFDDLDRHGQLAPQLTEALVTWNALPRC